MGLPEKENLRPDEVAAYFNVSVQTVRNLFHAGELQGFYVGSNLRIKRYSVLDLEARRAASSQKNSPED